MGYFFRALNSLLAIRVHCQILLVKQDDGLCFCGSLLTADGSPGVSLRVPFSSAIQKRTLNWALLLFLFAFDFSIRKPGVPITSVC